MSAFPCPVCGDDEVFPSEPALDRHLHVEHPEEFEAVKEARIRERAERIERERAERAERERVKIPGVRPEEREGFEPEARLGHYGTAELLDRLVGEMGSL